MKWWKMPRFLGSGVQYRGRTAGLAQALEPALANPLQDPYSITCIAQLQAVVT